MKMLIAVVAITGWLAASAAVALTATPSALPTPGVGLCTGDCDGSGSVSVAEIITCVNIALDNLAPIACPACDANSDAVVSIDELLTTVAVALSGCGTDAFEPDDTPQTARVIRCGDLQRHAIEPAGDLDWMALLLDGLSGVVISTSGARHRRR